MAAVVSGLPASSLQLDSNQENKNADKTGLYRSTETLDATGIGQISSGLKTVGQIGLTEQIMWVRSGLFYVLFLTQPEDYPDPCPTASLLRGLWTVAPRLRRSSGPPSVRLTAAFRFLDDYLYGCHNTTALPRACAVAIAKGTGTCSRKHSLLAGVLLVVLAAASGGSSKSSDKAGNGATTAATAATSAAGEASPTAKAATTAEATASGSSDASFDPLGFMTGQMFGSDALAAEGAVAGDADPDLKAALLTESDLPSGYQAIAGDAGYTLDLPDVGLKMAMRTLTQGGASSRREGIQPDPS